MTNNTVEVVFDSFKYSIRNGCYFKESIYFSIENKISESEVPKRILKELHQELKKLKQIEQNNAASFGQMRPGPSHFATTPRRSPTNVRSKLQPAAANVRPKLPSYFSHGTSASSSVSSAKNLTKMGLSSKRPLAKNFGSKSGKIDGSLSGPATKRYPSTKKVVSSRKIDHAELSQQLALSFSDDDDVPFTSTTSTANVRPRESFDYSFQLPNRSDVSITDENRERVDAFKKRGDKCYNILVHAAKILREFEDNLSRLQILEKPANARINAPLEVLDLADVLTYRLPFIKASDIINFCMEKDVILLNVDAFLFSDPGQTEALLQWGSYLADKDYFILVILIQSMAWGFLMKDNDSMML